MVPLRGRPVMISGRRMGVSHTPGRALLLLPQSQQVAQAADHVPADGETPYDREIGLRFQGGEQDQ